MEFKSASVFDVMSQPVIHIKIITIIFFSFLTASDETYLVATNFSFLGAKMNRAYVCPRNERFKLKEKNGGAVGYVNMNDIKFQPFGVTGIHFRKGQYRIHG